MNNEYYTFREYMKSDRNNLSASMEDYLEMIYRLSDKSGYTRVTELASCLNVQPPSVSKMLLKLAELELINYKKYGIIIMSKKGKSIGKSLLQRHNIIERFLIIIGMTENLLQETEKIEHTINTDTLNRIYNLVNFFENNPDTIEKFNNFIK